MLLMFGPGRSSKKNCAPGHHKAAAATMKSQEIGVLEGKNGIGWWKNGMMGKVYSNNSKLVIFVILWFLGST